MRENVTFYNKKYYIITALAVLVKGAAPPRHAELRGVKSLTIDAIVPSAFPQWSLAGIP